MMECKNVTKLRKESTGFKESCFKIFFLMIIRCSRGNMRGHKYRLCCLRLILSNPPKLPLQQLLLTRLQVLQIQTCPEYIYKCAHNTNTVIPSMNRSKYVQKQVEEYIQAKTECHANVNQGSHPERKVQFFLTLFKRPLPPPPFYLNICPILQGVFFKTPF